MGKHWLIEEHLSLSSKYFLGFFSFFFSLVAVLARPNRKKISSRFLLSHFSFLTNIGHKPFCQKIIEGVNSEMKENQSESVTKPDDGNVSMGDTAV